jgi:hypothetical protein
MGRVALYLMVWKGHDGRRVGGRGIAVQEYGPEGCWRTACRGPRPVFKIAVSSPLAAGHGVV